MNFASYDFWKILTICIVGSQILIQIAKAVSPDHESLISKLCLATTGLVLLGSESWLTLGVFLWVVGLSWIGVLVASREGFRKDSAISRIVFVILLVGQLAPLFYYKYWTFVLHDWLGLKVSQPSVLIPMGLSFYTFQKIGFWIDTIRNPGSRPRFLDYLNFCSFFPQIVAGPIEKRDSLLPQIQSIRFKIHRANLDSALQWIILGLAYKLIVADNLGTLSQKFQIDPSNAWHVWLECLIFGMRIYFDFAGYSFIAVGLGLLFGVRLTLNFRCPYWSRDLREFWRNWHVTLGAWLRDYIYLPLGGKRVSWWALNTLIVFLVSGIWHGAGWGFLIWGLMHGVGVVFSSVGKPWEKLGPLRWFITFAYTIGAWLFFFETNPHTLKAKAISLCNPIAYGLPKLQALPAIVKDPLEAVTLALILAIACTALVAEGIGIRMKTDPYHYGRIRIASVCLVFLIVFLAPMEESRFIYFNF